MASSTKAVSSWEAVALLEEAVVARRQQTAASGMHSMRSSVQVSGVRALERALAQARAVTTGVDETVNVRFRRERLEQLSCGRLTGEEMAALLSLRPRSEAEALRWLPSLGDFGARVPVSVPAFARAPAVLEELVDVCV
jgi:hypothetical protein